MFSCEDNIQYGEQISNRQSVSKKDVSESLEKANRYLLIQETEQIDDYLDLHDMHVIQTGTGI